MAASPDSLGDFFAKKSKKKVKATNLNNATTASKDLPKKTKKDAEQEGWEEEEVVTQMMKVEVAGKLMRDEDKKDEDDNSAPAWGVLKEQKSGLNEKRYPSLAKAVASSNINIDDNSETKINISTTKNVFSALEDTSCEMSLLPCLPSLFGSSVVSVPSKLREGAACLREVHRVLASPEHGSIRSHWPSAIGATRGERSLQ